MIVRSYRKQRIMKNALKNALKNPEEAELFISVKKGRNA